MLPSREVFWHISFHGLLYPLALIVIVLFIYGFYRRAKLWAAGQPHEVSGSLGQRLKLLLTYGVAQGRVLKEIYPGLMHLFMYLGFLLLFIGTLIVSFDYDVWELILGMGSFLTGNFYLIFSLTLEIAGGVAILGVLIAFFRRYIQKPARLNNEPDNLISLIWLLIILLSGFFVEGARIASTHPQWAHWSLIGSFVSTIFVSDAKSWHRLLWWTHMFISMGFIVYIPFSRMKHLIISPMNIYLRDLKPVGELAAIDIENSEVFGAAKITDFTWKHLLDLEACTSCGRCQDQCPAFASQKPLSPKKLILDLDNYLNEKGDLVRKRSLPEAEPPLTGSVVQAEEIWACTTCGACVEACPVFINHIDKIVELRRDRVLMEGDFPAELNQTFRGMENNFNPWGIGFASRADWAEDLKIKRLDKGEKAEYLWFVGCAGSFDERAKKVSRAFAKILEFAHVDVGIFGSEEKCCGETARRLGNEYLAQTLMEMNIELFNSADVKKIITTCPHCYNTLKNEYPQFGGHYEVIHSSELLANLFRSGKIKLKQNSKKVTFHDSCYLGRYNKIYQQPRDVLNALSANGIIEMEHNREKSFCCGAGGGRMWQEETIGVRINHLRTEEVVDSGAEIVASACPYCLTMLGDGLKDLGKDEQVQAYDIIELTAMSLDEE